jgi:hypothetical protein
MAVPLSFIGMKVLSAGSLSKVVQLDDDSGSGSQQSRSSQPEG